MSSMGRTPTPKQKKAAELISENVRKDKPAPIGQILKQAGYSESISEKPALVTRSQGFRDLLEKAGVTDDKLGRVLNEGLAATKAVVMGKESSESFVDIQPDYAIRHKYLETALKVKGIGQEKGGDTNNYIQVIKEQTNKYV